MEKIKFNNLQSKKSHIIMTLVFIPTLVGIFKPFNFFSEEFYKWMFGVGSWLLFIFFFRIFWFKNYVQWNNRGMIIKINSWIGIGRYLKFDEIKSINFAADTIEITLFGGRRKRVINLKYIVLEDQQRLQQILQKYLGSAINVMLSFQDYNGK